MTNREEKGLKQVGIGSFGPIYTGLTGEDAVQFLLEKQEGEVLGAFEYGKNKLKIDLIWGRYDAEHRAGIGLAKIVGKHRDVLKKGLDNLIRTLHKKAPKSPQDAHKEIVLEDEETVVIIRLVMDNIYPKRWLMTAYNKKRRGYRNG